MPNNSQYSNISSSNGGSSSHPFSNSYKNHLSVSVKNLTDEFIFILSAFYLLKLNMLLS